MITSLWCIGFYAATEKGNILHFIKKPVLDWLDRVETERQIELSAVNILESQAEKQSNRFYLQREEINKHHDNEKSFIMTLYKPIFLCPRCMSSLHSSFLYCPLTVMNYGWPTFAITIVPAVFIITAINSILHNHSDL